MRYHSIGVGVLGHDMRSYTFIFKCHQGKMIPKRSVCQAVRSGCANFTCTSAWYLTAVFILSSDVHAPLSPLFIFMSVNSH